MQKCRTVRITNNNKEERRDIANLFGIIEGAVEPGEEGNCFKI